MKIRILSAVMLAILLSLSLVACGEEPVKEADEYFSVTLEYNNGTPAHTVRTPADKPMAEPKAPEREGYIFGGWRGANGEWRFESDAVLKDMTLTAIWIDASSLFSYSVLDDGTVRITEYSGSIASIGIPEIISGYTVSAIADGLFADTDKKKIARLSIPSTVDSVGEYALEGFGQTQIDYTGSLVYLGEGAFASCAGLTSVSLGEGLEKIPYNAFGGCTSLTSLEIPASVTVIEENAFHNCESVRTVVIGAKDVIIENAAFSGCDSLVSVFFAGSEEEWDALVTRVDNGGAENSSLLDAKIFFLSDTEPEGEGNYWYRTDSGEIRAW